MVTRFQSAFDSSISIDSILQPILTILNNQQKLFVNWHSWHATSSGSKLMKELIPWMTRGPPTELYAFKKTVSFNHADVDCSNPNYRTVFTGKTLSNFSRIIVDFIPFGYDIEKLEVRFYELYDVVDAFVLYESPLTQSGIDKPLFFSLLYNTTRFIKWKDKIIYLKGEEKELATFKKQTLRGMRYPYRKSLLWSLERSMRSEMIRKFAEIDIATNHLKHKIMNNIDNVYATQNDADEIPSLMALLHIKHCEIIANVDAIYLPSLAFKGNFHWLQYIGPSGDTTCSNVFLQTLLETTSDNIDLNDAARELQPFLWRSGPFLWPLTHFLRSNETLRRVTRCNHHMGLGSAVHMTSTAEPGEQLFKLFGVVESTPILPLGLIAAGRQARITVGILMQELVHPWCAAYHTSTSRITNPLAREIVWTSIPWIVRSNPKSFPFLLPAPLKSDMTRYTNNNYSWIDDEDIIYTSIGKVIPSTSCHHIIQSALPDWTRTCEKKPEDYYAT